jgi:hypothetical protein
LSRTELADKGRALFGRGWQTKLAKRLEVNPSTVRRWVSGAVAVPGPAAAAIRGMIAPACSQTRTDSMTVLFFNDRGWEIATAAWTVGARPGKTVRLCYQWGADHVSFFHGATGISTIDLGMTMQQFLSLMEINRVIDLRPYQG